MKHRGEWEVRGSRRKRMSLERGFLSKDPSVVQTILLPTARRRISFVLVTRCFFVSVQTPRLRTVTRCHRNTKVVGPLFGITVFKSPVLLGAA
jgi:hypothetical protein